MDRLFKKVSVLVILVCCLQTVFSGVLISEMNADTPGQDTKEYIELYNNGFSPVSLDDFVIVLYDGSTNEAYYVVSLQGKSISPYGYFVIGSSIVLPKPDIELGTVVNILQNGVDAVALYQGDVRQFTVGMSATANSLVDAVVYYKQGRTTNELIDVLTPNQVILREYRLHLDGEDESLSRCRGMDPLKLSQFQLSPLTPGSQNNCSSVSSLTTDAPQVGPGDGFPGIIDLPTFSPGISDVFPRIVINEISVDRNSGQFIELYDGGVGDVSLDNLIIVLYKDRTEASYGRPISLTGFVTDENGYLLIGPPSLQPHIELPRTLRTNRVNAVALYFEHPDNMGPDTAVTADNLVDAVVYAKSPRNRDSALIDVLSPGALPQVQTASELNTSLARCRSWQRLNAFAFTVGTQTPGMDNICSLPDFFINEINVAVEGELTDQFVEIFDGGIGYQSLQGIVLVLYNGRNSLSYIALDLTSYSTNEHGLCVIGWDNGTNVDVAVEFDASFGFLQPGPDAVALHLGSPERFLRGKEVTNYNLIDAVVYGNNPALSLLHTLLPNQQVLNELGGSISADQSISRCSCCQRLNASDFGVGSPSPGNINVDCVQNNKTHIETLDHYINLIRLNEIVIARQDAPLGDFVEIYDGGFGGVGLDNMVLVLYASLGESSYKVIDLEGFHTDASGFLVIGSQSIQSAAVSVEDNHWFQGDGGAVAIHKGLPADFAVGTRASSANLVDAVVYGDSNLLLLELLTPGQGRVNYSVSTGETSIQRCFSRNAFEILAYMVGAATPGTPNDCPLPPITINEVNVEDVSLSTGEYVELSSNGIPRFPLNDLLMIFWRGSSSLSYRAIAINGRRTDKNGLFLIGSRGMSSPRPDLTPFIGPTTGIRLGTNAISIHRGLKKYNYPKRTPLTTEGLVDSIIHGRGASQLAQHLIDFFKPNTLQINEVDSWSERDESINRCQDGENNTVYRLAHITPKAPNHCPSRADAKLIINEINLIPSEQFIELWDLGSGFTSLDDFVVVLFGEDDQPFWSIPLTGFATDSLGYFIMGVASVFPRAQFIFADGFMRYSVGAVALYRASLADAIIDGGSASANGLLDAVVYSNVDTPSTTLLDVLTPTYAAVDSRLLQTSGFSLSRCLSKNLRSPRPFRPQPQSPKDFNNCPVYSDDVIINEINVQHPGQEAQEEFIELYDGGVGNKRLQYLSLVLFNGNYEDRSYHAVDLHGKRTDQNGYLLIASQHFSGVANLVLTTSNQGFLQDGPDAIALYRAPVGAFPQGTEATSRSLVDAVIYSTEAKEHISLVDKLMPGRFVVVEDSTHATGDETISRCQGNQRLSPEVYSMGLPTPGWANNCSKSSSAARTDVVINEVNIEASNGGGEFIELSDLGKGFFSLKGFLLVLYNGGNQDRSYLEVDLTGYSTNSQGFLVVGTSAVNPTPVIVLPDNFLQNGPDAVALYYTEARLFPRGTIATSMNIVDVVIYGRDGGVGSNTLVDKLAPGQMPAVEDQAYLEEDESLSRCLSNRSVSLSAFTVSQPSPGQPNICIGTPVIISEVKLNGNQVGFIELYDGGRGSTPLDSLSVVLYDHGEAKPRAYSVQSLLGHTTNVNGYFVYGKPSSEWHVDLEISAHFTNFPHNSGSSAVSLYKDKENGSFRDDSELVDAMVYGFRDPSNTGVINALIPGQSQIQISSEFSHGDMSISRCACCQTLDSTAFALATPTPGLDNQCVAATAIATPTDIIINEVSAWTRGAESKEYVELRGPPGTRLDGFTLVLATSIDKVPIYYSAFSLVSRAISSDGIFVIGTSNVSPPPNALFPASSQGIIRPSEGAVAVYRMPYSASIPGTLVDDRGLVDAVVFTNDSSQAVTQLSSILTPGFNSFYTGNFSAIADIISPSISRCVCCDSLDPDVFTLSTPSPGHTNKCPSRQFGRTVQLHILDAAYDVWMGNPKFVNDLKKRIVEGVNSECKCGFNEFYLKDGKLFNGSVYFQVEMLALSSSHSSLLYDSYVSFVKKTTTLTILGIDFLISNECFSDCLSGNLPGTKGQQIGKGVKPVVAVAIVIVVIVVVTVLSLVIYVFLRRRHGILSFIKNGRKSNGMEGEFRVTHKCTINDIDELGDSVTQSSSGFGNPVYLYETHSAPKPQPGPVEVTDGNVTGEESAQASGETEGKVNGMQS